MEALRIILSSERPPSNTDKMTKDNGGGWTALTTKQETRATFSCFQISAVAVVSELQRTHLRMSPSGTLTYECDSMLDRVLEENFLTSYIDSS